MPYSLKSNPIKAAIRDGRTVFGMYIAIPSPAVLELAGQAGFDFVRIDCYHSPLDLFAAEHMMRAAESRGVAPFVRVNNDPQKILSLLEMGAMGIIVPDVSDVETAQAVVNAAKFAPVGERGMFSAARGSGYGAVNSAEYAKWSNAEIIVGVQIESAQAVENVEEILSVPGIGMVLSGRGDLAHSLGVTGQKNHPLVLEAERKIFAAAKEKGIAVSVNLDSTSPSFADDLKQWILEGVDVITLGHDIAIIRKTFENMMSLTRS